MGDATREVAHGRRLCAPVGGRPFPSRYLLYVGMIEPRKNVERLIGAFALAAPDLRSLLSLWLETRLVSLSE